MTETLPLSWPQARTYATEALEATLERLARTVPAELLCSTPLPTPPRGRDLEAWATTTRRWVDQQFFVVDTDLDASRTENRHMAKLRRFEGSHLWLTLPSASRMALGDARQLRVFCVSNVQIRLKQALLRALKDATRGRLVAELWSPKVPILNTHLVSPPGKRTLNDGQREALAAMTSPGAWLIWGPPGTGKTTVITAAVRHALASEQTVLIASHTHVAVDNVLEGLLNPDDPPSWPAPGEMIRIASATTQNSVSPVVREHEYAILDKAVAKLTGQVERQADLERQREQNRTHQARQQLRQLIEDLADVHVEEIRRAQHATQANAEAAELEPHLADLEQRLTDTETQSEAHREAAATFDVSAKELHEAQTAAKYARQALANDEQALAEAAAAVQACRRERAAAGEHLRKARAAIDKGLGRLLPQLRERRARNAADMATRVDESQSALNEAESSHTRWTEVRQEAAVTLTDTEERLLTLNERVERAHRETRAADALADTLDQLRAEHAANAERLADLQSLATAIPAAAAQEILAEAEQHGLLTKLERREALNQQVIKLDKALKDLGRQQTRLEEKVANERARLLAEAPVIACTLAALSTTQALLKRRFDVVILDEAASIEAPDIAYAGSRADRTLALVGDFLQNAPIAEADDIITAEDQPRAEWQQRDIFHLTGIHDRASAEQHPRCVALRTQYRYPPLIADVVNAFCYDGLLETHESHRSHFDGPLITLIDTTGHPGNELQRTGSSWSYQLGLDLLRVIVAETVEHTTDIGYICPYAPQADRAQRLADRERLPVQCGTAHRFQGREFDTVIVDLMQDTRPRWAGVADLLGTERQVAAAKLLNVALTRTKTRLYLIGDWDFIQRQDTPGMQAIASLNQHPAFELTTAKRLTEA
jgi:hypothetical protein